MPLFSVPKYMAENQTFEGVDHPFTPSISKEHLLTLLGSSAEFKLDSCYITICGRNTAHKPGVESKVFKR